VAENDPQESAECFLEKMPFEMKTLVVAFAGMRTFYNMMQVSKQWRNTLCPQGQLMKKAVAYVLKQYCYYVWPAKIVRAQQKFISQFENFRHML
jgi:hypothetical protein